MPIREEIIEAGSSLSPQAKALWAKKPKDGSMTWLPLACHLADAAAIADRLWEHWLSEGVKKKIAEGIDHGSDDAAKHLLVFLAAAHDIGKATPVFQAQYYYPKSDIDDRMEEKLRFAGLVINSTLDSSKVPHALATSELLRDKGFEDSICAILGAHHGKPQDSWVVNAAGVSWLETFPEYFHLKREHKNSWLTVQDEIIEYVLRLSDYQLPRDLPVPNMSTQVLLCGLVIMADWIASNEQYFPYVDFEDSALPDSLKRADEAIEKLSIPSPWEASLIMDKGELYQERFGFDSPNAMQESVLEIACGISKPGIMVIEAPMGEGKTEAALATAEVFACMAERSGVFFALPTQATSDGMYGRFREWMDSALAEEDDYHSIVLAHGKAQFNEEHQALKSWYFGGDFNVGEDESDAGEDDAFGAGNSAIVHEWFEGRKKSMLADFVVGTVDQLLLAALKQKHVMLRHLGLANKVVIIDECHAYDAYMDKYLEMALMWLGSYGVPVIVLSATLPAEKRQSVIKAYLGSNAASEADWTNSRAYPLITWSDGYDINGVRCRSVELNAESREVRIEHLDDDFVPVSDKITSMVPEGGCVGVIMNTVKRAQDIYEALRKRFGQDELGDEIVRLLHSRFLAPHRIAAERELAKELGKPEKASRPYMRIVVGTQVLEQSLDIDFDALVTDLCPMDLLLQRIGRLHRHERLRPDKLKQAICYIVGAGGDDFEGGSKSIYGAYLLMRTKTLLPDVIMIPEDISDLVQGVYSGEDAVMSASAEYNKAKEAWEKRIESKEKRAKDFRISKPWSDDLVGWLSTSVPDKSDGRGDAAVRDADETVEVLALREKDGMLFLLDDTEATGFSCDEVPSDDDAIVIARQSVSLPSPLCHPGQIDATITALEEVCMKKNPAWQRSKWLKGSLFLIFDENGETSLCGYRLAYNKRVGLICEKEMSGDA
jgi:CRISPR-associated endonuclease/helicase Cas3